MKSSGLVFSARSYIGSAEPPPTVLEDESRYGNDGAFLADGEPNWVRNEKGLWVLDFDGTNDIVTIPDHSSLDITAATMMVWVNLTNTPSQYDEIIVRPLDIYEIYFPNGGALTTPSAYFTCSGGGVVRAGAVALNTNKWYHLVATYNSVIGAIFYTDAVPSATTGANGTINASANPLYVGGDGTRFIPAQIVKVRILNYALSAEQIVAIYFSEKHWFGR